MPEENWDELEKTPLLFAKGIVANAKKEERKKEKIRLYNEQLKAESEERRQERQRENRVRFVKNVVYTISGLLGVLCIYALMVLCALVK